MILEMRKRKYYVKPSEKRAKAKAAGRALWLKKQRELASLINNIVTGTF